MVTASLGTLSFHRLGDADCFSILDTFCTLGGTQIDTAPLYGEGRVERLLQLFSVATGAALAITSKVGHFQDEESYRNPKAWRSQLTEICDRLGRVPGTILLHEADWEVWWRAAGARAGVPFLLEAPCEIEFARYADFEVLCREFGCRPGISGNHAMHLLLVAQSVCPQAMLVAKQLDALWRTGLPLVEYCTAHKVPLCLASPLHQGWLLRLDDLRGIRPELAEHIAPLNRLAAKCGLTVPELSFAFVRRAAPASSVVFGADSAGQVVNNLAALDRCTLNDEEFELLMTIGGSFSPMPGPLTIPG